MESSPPRFHLFYNVTILPELCKFGYSVTETFANWYHFIDIGAVVFQTVNICALCV